MNHQTENAAFFLSRKYACDFSEQGTGKTFTAIATALNREGIERVVVVCPRHLIDNWVSELQVFGVPREAILKFWFSSKAKRVKALETINDYDFIVVNYGHLKLTLDSFTKLKNFYLLVDEAHEIGNMKTKVTKAVLKLAKASAGALFMTGTPLSNSPFKVYPFFTLCLPTAFKDFNEFKYHFADFSLIDTGRVTPWGKKVRVEVVQNYKNLTELYKLLKFFSRRVTKEEALDLPERIFVNRLIEMEPKQAKMYRQAEEELLIELSNGEMIDVTVPITKVTRLRQVCSNPFTIDEEYADDKHILNSEQTLLKDLENYDGKVVVVVSFKSTFHRLEKLFDENKIRYVSVRGGEKNVGDKVSIFNNTDCKVFLGLIDSIYTGLNLQKASTLIMYENTYNLLHYSQVIDRVHRKGQENKVVVIHYIRKHPSISKTSDEIILSALQKKINTEDAVLRYFAKNILKKS